MMIKAQGTSRTTKPTYATAATMSSAKPPASANRARRVRIRLRARRCS
jgi:hypothetical protein